MNIRLELKKLDKKLAEVLSTWYEKTAERAYLGYTIKSIPLFPHRRGWLRESF